MLEDPKGESEPMATDLLLGRVDFQVEVALLLVWELRNHGGH